MLGNVYFYSRFLKRVIMMELQILIGLQELIHKDINKHISNDTWHKMLEELLKDRDKNFNLFYV